MSVRIAAGLEPREAPVRLGVKVSKDDASSQFQHKVVSAGWMINDDRVHWFTWSTMGDPKDWSPTALAVDWAKIDDFWPAASQRKVPMPRNLGRFQITCRMIEYNPAECMKIMDGVIVLEANRSFYTGCIEYVALHADFDVVKDGDGVPLYLSTVTYGDVTTRKWHRVP